MGIPEIDLQHQGLLEVINELWGVIVARADVERVARVLDKLEQYTQAHFTAEEALMRVEEYPKFRDHRSEHKEFSNFVASAKAKLQGGEFLGLDLLRFLTEWLVKHIQGGDRDYAKWIADRRRPESIFARFFGAFQGKDDARV